MTTTSTPTPALQIGTHERALLNQVLDKWSLQVLERLCEQPMRFNDLRRAIPGVSQKSLSSTLRRMERNGILIRTVISTRPVAVEYDISPLGKTLREPVDALIIWVAENAEAVEHARAEYDDAVPA